MDFGYATSEQIEGELDKLLTNVKVRLEPGSREALVKACQGLTMNRVRQVLAKAVARHGRLDETDIALVLEEKKQMVRRTEVLEFYAAQENMDDIGGLDLLKDWLRKRTRAFSEEAKRYGLPNPKGVLLVGIQGTGKSLSAKAVSQLWKFPLLRLDVGRLMGSLVGQSEERTRQMIQLAEAMASCVLWIDEIEQAVRDAMQNAFAEEREFTTEDLVRAVEEIVPLARTAEDQIERLTQWAAAGRARPASSDAGVTTQKIGWSPPVEPAAGVDVDLPPAGSP